MTAEQVDARWDRPEDQQWADLLLWHLVWDHDVPGSLAGEVLEEARRASEESGESPEHLFGAAREYARQASRDRQSVEERASVDLEGVSLHSGWQILLLGVGLTGTLLSAARVIMGDGWWVEVTPSGLTVTIGGALCALVLVLGLAQRQAGRLRQGWVQGPLAAAGILAVVVVIGTALQDRPALMRLPVLIPGLLCLGMLVIAARLPSRPPPPEDDTRDASPEEWFTRLHGLLRGRYYLSRHLARQYTEEARQYWQDSGARHPREEFGPPQTYALTLVEDTEEPARGKDRHRSLVAALLAAYCAFQLWETAQGELLTWAVAWRAILTVTLAWLALRAWRDSRSRHHATDST